MQVCYNCHSKQLDGTIFCTECGASLLTPSRRETTTAPKQTPLEDAFTPAQSAAAPERMGSGGPTLSLFIVSSRRRIRLQIHEDLLIGRKDEARNIRPDIDLGPDGGYDAGVSRRHAILSYKDGKHRVEDLGSSNGTFVNDKQLVPLVPTPLVHGDEIKCGKLLMRIEIE